MTRLEPETRERYVPIPTATRLKAYTVSPTFARLGSYLEGPASDRVARDPTLLSRYGRPPTGREFFVTQLSVRASGRRLQGRCPDGHASLKHYLPQSLGNWNRPSRSATSAPEAEVPQGSRPLCLATTFRIMKQTAVSLRLLYTLKGMVVPTAGVSSRRPRRSPPDGEPDAYDHSSNERAEAPRSAGSWRGVAPFRISRDFGLEMAAYAISTATLLAFVLVTLARHRRDPTREDQTFAAIVLCGSLLAFSVTIALVDVLACPILKWVIAYNPLGYSPLSVLSAFGLVILFSWVQSPGIVSAVTDALSSKGEPGDGNGQSRR